MATDSSSTPKPRDGQAQPGTPPDDAPVAPGLDPATQIRDNLGRPTAVAGDKAVPIKDLLVSTPA